MRRRVYETGQTEMLTRDKKNIIARTFVVWRIGDPLAFTQAIGNRGRRRGQAGRPADQCGHRNPGRARSLGAGVHQPDRSAGGPDRVRTAGLDGAAGAAQLWRGHRADSPRAHRAARGERDRGVRSDARRAASIRREVRGRRRAAKPAGSVPRRSCEAARIRAKGAEETARIRGESAAQVAKTYADAHRIDPDLYRFTRSLDRSTSSSPATRR